MKSNDLPSLSTLLNHYGFEVLREINSSRLYLSLKSDRDVQCPYCRRYNRASTMQCESCGAYK